VALPSLITTSIFCAPFMAAFGSECGLCLRAVTACPDGAIIAQLPQCNAVYAVGDLCEGDGECGTDRTLNNCGINHDVYERCDSSLRTPPWPPPDGPASPPLPAPPPSPPMPPLLPLLPCAPGVCVAGAECGLCLRHLNADECPTDDKVAELPGCFEDLALNAGCEGDGECGTDRTANNCGTYHNHDVYERVACIPSASSDPGSGSPPPDALGSTGVLLLSLAAVGALALVGLGLYWTRRGGRAGAASRKSASRTTRAQLGGGGRVPAEVTTATVANDSKGEAFVVNVEM